MKPQPYQKEIEAFEKKFLENRREDGESFDEPPYPSIRDIQIKDFIIQTLQSRDNTLLEKMGEIIEKHNAVLRGQTYCEKSSVTKFKFKMKSP
jgi:hypothetical protein